MNSRIKLTPQDVAVTAARGGIAVDEAKAQRIANAISPAVATFDCTSLRLPMTEEPAGWTQRALAGARK